MEWWLGDNQGRLEMCHFSKAHLCVRHSSPPLPPLHLFSCYTNTIFLLIKLPKLQALRQIPARRRNSAFKMQYCNPVILSSALVSQHRKFQPFCILMPFFLIWALQKSFLGPNVALSLLKNHSILPVPLIQMLMSLKRYLQQ